jgi:7-cyano-7-deazaguanine synthase
LATGFKTGSDEFMETMKCVAVISGGIDSISYAIYNKKLGYEIYPIIFKYGQKGSKEVDVAVKLCKELGFQTPLVLDISFMKELWIGTQLTDEEVDVEKEYTPSVVVPLRNAVFLTIATAYALTIRAKRVIYGSHLDDCSPSKEENNFYFAVYPDCSPEFIQALETALRLGSFRFERDFEIWSPAKEGLTKRQNLRRAYEILKKEGKEKLLYETWSCYKSGEKQCGICESCRNRKKVFKEAGIPDLTEYEVVE